MNDFRTETTVPQATSRAKVPNHEKHEKTDHKVQSIPEMLELFSKGIPVIFLGGQMGTLDENGKRLPITDRYGLQNFCEKNNIYYYDPIYGEPDDPTFFVSRQTDKTALLLSLVDVLSIGKESIAGVSMLEAIFDSYLGKHPHLDSKRIIFFPDASSLDDVSFAPPDLEYTDNGRIDFQKSNFDRLSQHYQTAIHTGNLLRNELLQFSKESKRLIENGSKQNGLILADNKEEFLELQKDSNNVCYEITSSNLHINDMIKAFSDIFSDKKVVIFFHPPVNLKNIPVMHPGYSEFPKEREKILNQYISEGNSIRKFVTQQLQHENELYPGKTTFTFTEEETQQALLKLYNEMLEKRGPELKDSQNPNPSYMAQ